MFRKFSNLGWRTVQAFIPALSKPDDAFAREWLSSAEYGLYLQLDPRDRAHSVLVARKLLDLGAADREAVAAALLHDVAKALLPFNPLHRVIAHLYRPVGLPAEPLAGGLRGTLQLREHHERLGAAMIMRAGGSTAVARLVRDIPDHSRREHPLPLLRQADDLT